jgi:hypothetical protein
MSEDLRKAVHGFLHSLFQALGQASSGPLAAPRGGAEGDQGGSPPANRPAGSAVQSAYGNLAENLQSLASTLDREGQSSLSELQDNFENLVSALGAGGDTGKSAAVPGNHSAATAEPEASRSGVTLRAFLQSLAENLGSQNELANGQLGGASGLFSASA